MEKNLNKKELEQYNKSIKSFDVFLNGTTYNLDYHFPKPIKKVSISDVVFSVDKKTLYYKKPINNFISNYAIFDFDVELEK